MQLHAKAQSAAQSDKTTTMPGKTFRIGLLLNHGGLCHDNTRIARCQFGTINYDSEGRRAHLPLKFAEVDALSTPLSGNRFARSSTAFSRPSAAAAQSPQRGSWMRSVLKFLCPLVLLAAVTARLEAATYAVGPGQPYAAPSAVPWEVMSY
jgi:hypothetical protein